MVVSIDLCTITLHASNNEACNNCNNIINPLFYSPIPIVCLCFLSILTLLHAVHLHTQCRMEVKHTQILPVSLCFCKEPAGHEWKGYHIFPSIRGMSNSSWLFKWESGAETYTMCSVNTPLPHRQLHYCIVWFGVCIDLASLSLSVCVCTLQ